jgi:hypothetical protein
MDAHALPRVGPVGLRWAGRPGVAAAFGRVKVATDVSQACRVRDGE